MSSRLRLSLLLTTLFALFQGVSGAGAPVGRAADPPNANIAGINVDATTIPQLQKLMDSGVIDAVDLTNFFLRRIRDLNPKLHAVITVSPTALNDARAATGRGGTALAFRCSGFRSSSRTMSTPPACRRRPAPGHSPGARPVTRSSRRG